PSPAASLFPYTTLFRSAGLDRQIFQYEWRKDGGVLAVAADGFRNHFAGYNARDTEEDITKLATNPGQFALSTAGEIAFAGQTATDRKSTRLNTSHGSSA